MRVLLDTNIIIHREANRVINKDIGILFNWLDRLHSEKIIHPRSLHEIRKYQNKEVVATFEIKLKNYNLLKTEAPETPQVEEVRSTYDKTPNDYIDTSLLKEVLAKRVDLLVTEDRQVHFKAGVLGVDDRVFTIDGFLEKVTAENPELSDYKVLSVKKEYFGNLNVNDPFFDSFKEDYEGFADWFNRKSDEVAYTCKADDGSLLSFLYVKFEGNDENYRDISPEFLPKRRLKIGTLKVTLNGYKLGERFLKIVFDNAMQYRVDDIYVTIFDKRPDQQILINILEDWGFTYHGVKQTDSGKEMVYVRSLSSVVNNDGPAKNYPYISLKNRKFIVPIYPAYHTELFPDSILRTESPHDFVENRPNRNALRKVYISRAIFRDLRKDDIIVFYRTGSGYPAHYTSVATTIGIVESVITDIKNVDDFISHCRKRSVFTDKELVEQWDYNRRYRPFVVNFIYFYSFPKRMNLMELKDNGIIGDAPRGFEKMSDIGFSRLLEGSNADMRLIVD